ncbi:glycosyltransferase family 9 protein, partial [bacterium]|nr:glycosyltransferase family 9 protein [bacterium]
KLLCCFFPKRPIVTANIQRILVVKLCCIGDILFTTPLLRALQEAFPRAKITYMVCSWCRELAAADPRVQDVIEFNAYDKVTWLEKLRRTRRVIQEIKARNIDLALVLHRTPLAGILAAMAGVPVRIGFNWQGGGFAHTHPVPFRETKHEIDRHLDCLEPLDIHTKDIAPKLQPPPTASAAATAFLNQQGYPEGKAAPLIAVFPAGGVNPGTRMVTKRWSVQGFQAVCGKLVKNYGARILLIGNQDDVAVGDELVAKQSWSEAVIRSEGKTSLLLLAALLQKCVLFVGGDSGPLHIADAVGIPTVSIFGPTDPALLAPRGEQHRTIHKSLPCAPCYNPVTVKRKNVTVCQEKHLICMETISSTEVMQAVDELMHWKGYRKQ